MVQRATRDIYRRADIHVGNVKWANVGPSPVIQAAKLGRGLLARTGPGLAERRNDNAGPILMPASAQAWAPKLRPVLVAVSQPKLAQSCLYDGIKSGRY
ncbi:hypothetical protein PUN28_009840 [Cardiocondyla obscurior]|uniref:Uncharacterized protein n=1 Tax=Cardiocondyla obscurior TaxID=286306 RepID=A0AAW2FP30_9HYME